MPDWAWMILCVLSVAVSGWGGYRYGAWHKAEAIEEALDRMLRVEPPDRTPGQPTNIGIEPSRVAEMKYRNTAWKG